MGGEFKTPSDTWKWAPDLRKRSQEFLLGPEAQPSPIGTPVWLGLPAGDVARAGAGAVLWILGVRPALSRHSRCDDGSGFFKPTWVSSEDAKSR
jgi:hypothetical protein